MSVRSAMNISVKESLEHVCEVFQFFGIEYISAEVLRRGKNEKKLNRRKSVVIKLNLLLNDLCVLYCFEFKRKFKPNYNEYIRKEVTKLEEQHLEKNRNSNRKRANCRPDGEEERIEEEYEDEDNRENKNNESDEENCYNEELDEDVNYFDELHIISPLVILLLERFQYPRLYHLLKCNFQMAKELLLCVGFLIDAIKLFEHFDKQQPFYDLLFNMPDGTSKSEPKKNVSPQNMDKVDDWESFYFINVAMSFLSNRPYDIEIFECEHFHKYLEMLKKNVEEKSPCYATAELGEAAIGIKKKKEDGGQVLAKNENWNEKDEDEPCSVEEFVHYDYSKYQENFLNYYGKKKWEQEEKEKKEGRITILKNDETQEENVEYENEGDEGIFSNGEQMYMMDIMKNINKHCSQLVQLEKQILFNVNQLQNYDNNRLMLFHRFNELISKYTEPHVITVNWNSSAIKHFKTDKDLNRGKKVNLNDNILFHVVVEDTEKESIEISKVSEQLRVGINSKGKQQQQQQQYNNSSSNVATTGRPNLKNQNAKGKNVPLEDNEFLNDINYDLLNDRININEFYILNNASLYSKIIHIYKNGLHFFHYEKLRAVFWLWLQSLFSDCALDSNDEINMEKKQKVNVTFNDINNNMFFFDNVDRTKEDDLLKLHVLNDLNDFEKNYILLKEYLKSKGCTIGYNKITGSEKTAAGTMSKLESITSYIHHLHLEFEAFYNYKKKSKSLSDEVFVEFLDDKKKHMVVNSTMDRDDYTDLANVIHKHLININKIKHCNPVLDISQIVEGIKKQNYIKTDSDISKMEMEDWNALYDFHKKQKNMSPSDKQQTDFSKRYIINLTNNSNYDINQKPLTYASSIFQYNDQFITNNDIYSFSENIFKINEDFEDLVKNKQNKCTHNFFHILDKVEKYMDCVAFNL